MRPTLGYGLMTLCLSSVLAYSGYSAMQPQSALADDGRGQPSSFNQAPNTMITGDLDESARTVSIGDTREQVLAALGQPSSIDATRNRWTYGSQILLFQKNRLNGSIKLDAMQSPRVKMVTSHVHAAAATKGAKTVAHRYASRATAFKHTSSRYSAPSAVKPTNIWQPMFQFYYSDRPLSRSASPATRGYGNNPLSTGNFYQPPFVRR